MIKRCGIITFYVWVFLTCVLQAVYTHLSTWHQHPQNVDNYAPLHHHRNIAGDSSPCLDRTRYPTKLAHSPGHNKLPVGCRLQNWTPASYKQRQHLEWTRNHHILCPTPACCSSLPLVLQRMERYVWCHLVWSEVVMLQWGEEEGEEEGEEGRKGREDGGKGGGEGREGGKGGGRKLWLTPLFHFTHSHVRGSRTRCHVARTDIVLFVDVN